MTVDPGQRISDYFTFLVCATDIDGTRTDNMMVVSFDTKNHKVNVLNIPRDVMCNNNRTGASRKINAAYGSHQDIDNTLKEVKKVIGFTPDKYIVVNFDGIAQIVDAIGGIDYNVPFKMIYNDPVQDLYIYFEPGMQHMNGEQVVEFLDKPIDKVFLRGSQMGQIACKPRAMTAVMRAVFKSSRNS